MAEHSRTLLMAAACLFLTSEALAGAEAGRLKARPCAVCHGEFGLSVLPQAPHLAGQPADYLEAQLKAYRSGKRVNEMMTLMSKPLSDVDIADLAAWFASIRIEVKAAP